MKIHGIFAEDIDSNKDPIQFGTTVMLYIIFSPFIIGVLFPAWLIGKIASMIK